MLPMRTMRRFFFFNDPATTEIYTLSLHDALPISAGPRAPTPAPGHPRAPSAAPQDRKSTRLNSSHVKISYAVFCLKKKTEREDCINVFPIAVATVGSMGERLTDYSALQLAGVVAV